MAWRGVEWRRAVGAVLLFCAPIGVLRAAPPVVAILDIRGLQAGAVTTLTFTGSELLPNPRLLSTAEIRSQKVREGARPDRVSIEVELDASATPGLENWWLSTDGGISPRAVLAVDGMIQRALSDQPVALPVALHGSLGAGQVQEAFFEGRAGQRVLCEVEAQRLQSRLRPVLKIYDSANLLLAWSPPQSLLKGDSRVEVRLPADGRYRVQVHDLQYNAGAPSHFRLKVGEWAYVDGVFPSTVQAGGDAEVQPVGKPASGGEVARGKPLRLPSGATGEATPVPWGDEAKASGPRPPVWLHAFPQVVEQSATLGPQPLPSLPVHVNGRISKPGEVDLYEIPVKPETEIEVQVVADALGSTIDAELELRDAKGARLAVADDGTGSPDPRLAYKVPKGVTSVLAAVRNVGAGSGDHCVYRLEAALKPAKPVESFNLNWVDDSHSVRVGNHTVLKVEVAREGYNGPIDLFPKALPPGVKVAGARISESATGTLLTVSGETLFEPAIMEWQGKAGSMLRTVRAEAAIVPRFQPWLEEAVALHASVPSGPEFVVEWAGNTAGQSMILGGKVTLPLRVRRPAGHEGSVRFVLLTSQARILKQAQLDAPRMLREEKPVLLAEDKKVQQLTDALNAAQKAHDAAKAAVAAALSKANAANTANSVAVPDNLTAAEQKAGQSLEQARAALSEAGGKLQNSTEAVLLIPPDLPEVPHQVAFKAELLKRDGRSVEAVAFSTVMELPVVNPIQVTLSGQSKAALDAKQGVTIEVVGKVQRHDSLKGEITVSIAGLPTGVAQAPSVKLKEGQTDFKFALKFPANAAVGPVQGIRVSAVGAPVGNIPLKSREVDVVLTLEKAADAAAPGSSG